MTFRDAGQEHGDAASSLLLGTAGLAVTVTAAIFGFFYAWVCSTMWGLDSLDPRVAITAMNAMNASVRNAVFAPAFFGTPVALLIAAALAVAATRRAAAAWFAAAALIYLVGAFGVTMAVNVPMNEALMASPVPQGPGEAEAAWSAYSGRWQVFNVIRTVVSGVAFVLSLVGFAGLVRLR